MEKCCSVMVGKIYAIQVSSASVVPAGPDMCAKQPLRRKLVTIDFARQQNTQHLNFSKAETLSALLFVRFGELFVP